MIMMNIYIVQYPSNKRCSKCMKRNSSRNRLGRRNSKDEGKKEKISEKLLETS